MTKPADNNQTTEQGEPALPLDSTPVESIGESIGESTAESRATAHLAQNATASRQDQSPPLPQEHGGQAGLEPTRYGDWEKKGRCTDF